MLLLPHILWNLQHLLLKKNQCRRWSDRGTSAKFELAGANISRHRPNLNQTKTNCSRNLNSSGIIVREMGPSPECIFRSLLQFLVLENKLPRIYLIHKLTIFQLSISRSKCLILIIFKILRHQIEKKVWNSTLIRKKNVISCGEISGKSILVLVYPIPQISTLRPSTYYYHEH